MYILHSKKEYSMKKYTMIGLSLCVCAHSMETTTYTIREPREWNAEEYARGNFFQEEAALQFLKESGINLTNKKVLDVGCGTGNITSKIATTAQYVHGIDASKNMIDYAQTTYGNIPNLSFEHSFAEDFTTEEQYDYALSLFCLHWIEDKQAAFEKINTSLKKNGEVFCTIASSSNPAPFGVAVLKELLTTLQPAHDFVHNINITQESDLKRYVISDEECKEILLKSGFEIITYEEKSRTHIFKDRKELALFQRPVAMSRPLFKNLPETEREFLFNEYINLCLTKLKKDENDNYIFNGTTTTVIHARKIANIIDSTLS
jgi:ubiquinone/menaquinone biosynthesis C-methylase UbiE